MVVDNEIAPWTFEEDQIVMGSDEKALEQLLKTRNKQQVHERLDWLDT